MVAAVTWPQVLAWRLQRHLLEPPGTLEAPQVVQRLCGVQAQVPSSAELAVRVRQARSRPGEVQEALADGRLMRTWAMRGALHLLEPRSGAAFLALIADARPWDRPSWHRAFGTTPERLERLRDAVAIALEGTTLTREGLIAAVAARPGLGEIADGLRSGWGTLLKPLAWQGELCHGPSQGNRVTFMRPKDAIPGWTGLPDMETATGLAVAAYLGAYGPATSDRFGQWLAGGFFGTRKLRGWFASLGDAAVEVDVEGEAAWMLNADVPDLVAAAPSSTIRLVPGFDQWVLGPGTADGHVVPAARRSLVSRQAGWVSPVVLVGGVVSGTWELDTHTARVAWFDETGRVPRKALEAEVARLGGSVGRELRLTVTGLAA
jgi:Winged helix DNA-binding domain